MRFCGEPPDFGAKRWPTGAAGFRRHLRAGDQFIQPRTGVGTIGFLRPMRAGRDDQDAIFGDAIAGQGEEAPAYVIGKRARSGDIEAQLDSGGDFINVLATRAGGADESLCEFRIWNRYGQVLFPE